MGKKALSYENVVFLQREIKPRYCEHALASTLEEGHAHLPYLDDWFIKEFKDKLKIERFLWVKAKEKK